MNKRHAKHRSKKKTKRPVATRKKRKYFVYAGISVIAWILLNLSYMISASGLKAYGDRYDYIFPFNAVPLQGLWAYDISEFIGYALVIPTVLILIFAHSFIKGTEKIRRRISLTSLVIPCILGFLMATRIDNYYLRMSYYNFIQIASAIVLIILLLELLYKKISG